GGSSWIGRRGARAYGGQQRAGLRLPLPRAVLGRQQEGAQLPLLDAGADDLPMIVDVAGFDQQPAGVGRNEVVEVLHLAIAPDEGAGNALIGGAGPAHDGAVVVEPQRAAGVLARQGAE